MCNLRLVNLQQALVDTINCHPCAYLWSFKSCDPPIVQFAVHACSMCSLSLYGTISQWILFTVWTIVAIRAFRDSDSCDWPTIDGFPPKQKPTLQTIVLNQLIEALDTPAGAKILSNPTVEEITGQQMQLVECMHSVVKKLA